MVRNCIKQSQTRNIINMLTPAGVMQVQRAYSDVRRHKVLRINGDGVGKELVSSAVDVIEAAGVNIDWTQMEMGYEHAQRTKGPQISEEHLQAFEEIKIMFKGPLTVGSGDEAYVTVRDRTFTSPNQVFRKIFNLYANIRPAKSVPGIKTPFPNVDLVIVRENTEDLYTGEERWVDDDTVEGIKRITRGASTNIAEAAWQYALSNNRHRITAVHKANVCKQTDGLFLSCGQKVASNYADKGIVYDEQLCDSLLTKLVQTPEEFDVLLCPNLFGDLVSDLAAGLIGSLGLMPSGQFGDGFASFEPAHGSAPDIAGQGISNPASQIKAAAMLCNHLGEHDAADRIDAAVTRVINEGKYLTPDLGGTNNTTEMAQAIIKCL